MSTTTPHMDVQQQILPRRHAFGGDSYFNRKRQTSPLPSSQNASWLRTATVLGADVITITIRHYYSQIILFRIAFLGNSCFQRKIYKDDL